MKTAVIIVNYNKKDLLAKCLRSLQQNTYPHIWPIVVDNGSTDESAGMVSTDFPGAHLIEMGYNSGFCRANNVGIAHALNSGCDGVILLNNDTEVDKDFIEAGITELDVSNRVGMVAPKILFNAHRDQFDSAGLLITKDGLGVNRLLHESSEKGKERCEVFCPAGAAAFFAAETLTDIMQDGMYLDEDFAYYLEDLDIGWRARLRGWSCAYTPRSVVYHQKNATSGGYSGFIAFHTNRNLYYNIIKNYPGSYCFRALFLAVLRYPALLFGIVVHMGAANRFQAQIGLWELMAASVKGWLQVLLHSGKMLQKRRYIQGRRRISHKDCEEFFHRLGLNYFESLYK